MSSEKKPLNASIGDLIISFHSSATLLASESFKVGFECVAQISVYLVFQENLCYMLSLVST